MSNKIDIQQVKEFVQETEFTDILQKAEPLGIIVKESGPLYLLASARQNLENKYSELQKQTNGIILEKDTNTVVCMAQNKMTELESFSDVVCVIENHPHSIVEYTEDGTVIRMYNYKGKWHTSTARCIDAEYSYWTSDRSFADLFWSTFDTSLLEMCDPECTYIFILLHTENRIVVKHTENTLVFVSKIHNRTAIESTENPFHNVIGIRGTKIIQKMSPMDLDLLYYPVKRGILVKVPNGTTYKYDFEDYTRLAAVRGNIRDIKYRYLELLRNPKELSSLANNYNEHFFMFAVIDHCINKTIQAIYKLYKDSHILQKVKVTEEHMYYKTLKQLHAQYKKTNKKITLDDVQAKVCSLDKSVLKRFLGWV
ncbi:hypothetical protein EB118_07035 [bacterium]|nr:hypothetical protein [bacterium]NDC94399.1 hypothetical protein [bacterium]NDD83940.1 hypothetical protein [bacterium]NDG29835.1 hypothetical protein [bacterium]